MNIVQVELPRCIRHASKWYDNVSSAEMRNVENDFAVKFVGGVCKWLEAVFSENVCLQVAK